MELPAIAEVDPFELPEWLGESEVTWRTGTGLHGSQHVRGELLGSGDPLPCDLLAADVAYPRVALDPEWRRSVHEQWIFGQVLLLEYDGRLTLAVPGTDFTADRVLDTLARLAKAVGVAPSRFVAALRL